MGLFTKFNVKDMELKNRVVMPPMCMYQAVDGFVNQWHYIHYSTRAIGGVGLIIMEATGVVPEGRISDQDLGIWSDDFIPGLRSVTDIVHHYGGKIAIQLNHAGRKSECEASHPLAPSPIPFGDRYKTPREMTQEDIDGAVLAFKEAAGRVLEAGFDAIEIHGAHGYLVNQFLSPLTNKRTDRYGGSIEGRSMFLRQVVEAIRTRWPAEKPLILRVSAVDYDEAGNTPEEIAKAIHSVKDSGVDLIHVSTGGVIPVAPKAYPGYQIEVSRIIKELTGLPTIAGGLVTQPAMAQEIVENRRGDLVYMGRELLRNPYWTLQAAKELRIPELVPQPYKRAF